jgi:hypothetical protein
LGAANFPGGFGRGGLDPVPEVSKATAKRPPRALLFDGLTKDYALDDEGRYLAVHPVDATVFQILRTVVGSIASAPSTGQTVGAIPFIDKKKIFAQVDDAVRVALKALVDRGSVQILAIIVEPRRFGAVAFEVRYLNLEATQDRQRQTFKSSP